MFAKRIDNAVKKEKIITERFFEPSRSAWPERALMLQTVKKKVVTERFFEPYRSTWPSLALMLQTVKKNCHGEILRAVSKCMAGTGTHATNR